MNFKIGGNLSRNYAIVILILAVLFVTLASLRVGLSPPPDWVTGWTAWLGRYSASAAGLWGIVKLINGTEKWLLAKAKFVSPDEVQN